MSEVIKVLIALVVLAIAWIGVAASYVSVQWIVKATVKEECLKDE